MSRSRQPAARQIRGFTIIELLTVVAVIGVLAAILIPTTSSARTSVHKARTRVQFSQWTSAFEAFRQEYGAYPQWTDPGVPTLLNQAAQPDPAGSHPFHDLLAGVRRDGSPIASDLESPANVGFIQNFRRIRFVTFAESDFVGPEDVAAGHNRAGELNLIRDSFHNTSIAVVSDTNLDGVINVQDAPAGFPSVSIPGGTATIRPTTLEAMGQTGGIHSGVIFYSALPGATTEDDLITSWR